MRDELGAFVAGPRVVVAGAATGPLAGWTFAAKDLFDVQGHVTGCGNPDWARTHDAAGSTAWCVQRLLDAGATLVGKTVTDEISLGLLGINRFDGTPINPRAPGRVAGGSSSGSAAAVAGGLADVALGTDSGGSVRIPSSYTGLYGLRPTQGAIPVDGLMTQAPSFDTVGFFAADAARLLALGRVLLAPGPESCFDEVLVATDVFALADDVVRDALQPTLRRTGLAAREVTLAPEGILDWSRQQRLLQSFEFGRSFSDWIDRTNPRFSFEVARSLVGAAALQQLDLSEARALRTQATARLELLLGSTRLLCLPTSPILPIRRDVSLSEMRAACDRILELTCIAGLAGLPQINLPWAETADGIPIGLSLIGPRGSDLSLLAFAVAR
jgi:amidase